MAPPRVILTPAGERSRPFSPRQATKGPSSPRFAANFGSSQFPTPVRQGASVLPSASLSMEPRRIMIPSTTPQSPPMPHVITVTTIWMMPIWV